MKLEPHNFILCPLCQQGHVQLAGIAAILPTDEVQQYNLVYTNLKPKMEGNTVFDTEREKMSLDIGGGVAIMFHCLDCDYQWRKYVANYEESTVQIEQELSDPFASFEEVAVEEDDEEEDDEGEEWKNS